MISAAPASGSAREPVSEAPVSEVAAFWPAPRGRVQGRDAAQHVEDRLRRGDPGLHRGMRALDLRHVEEPRGVPHQQPAREREPRDRLDAAFADRARAVGDPPPALEHGADLRMGLEALELLEGAQVRVGVVEPDHEPHRDLVVFEVVEERAAVGRAVERPPQGVHDQPRLVPGRVDLPQLLDADAVGLRIDSIAQVEALEQSLRQVSSAAFGEDGDPRVQLHPRLEACLRLPVAPHPHVPGRDPLDRAVLVVEHLGGGKAPGRSRRRAPPPARRASGRGSPG